MRLAVSASAVALFAAGCAQDGGDPDAAAAEPPPTPSPVAAATATPDDQAEPQAELTRRAGPEVQAVVFQDGNDRPKFELVTKPSAELADNRISFTMAGSSWLDLPYLQDHAEDTANMGVK